MTATYEARGADESRTNLTFRLPKPRPSDILPSDTKAAESIDLGLGFLPFPSLGEVGGVIRGYGDGAKD
jgi:hypothetical protein